MADDKDQLVGEQAMDAMSVAPPDPKTGALSSHSEGDMQGGESLMERIQEHPTDQQMQSDTALQDTSGEADSGVDDQDPLSAHPT
jgi:hypothetical protein